MFCISIVSEINILYVWVMCAICAYNTWIVVAGVLSALSVIHVNIC